MLNTHFNSAVFIRFILLVQDANFDQHFDVIFHLDTRSMITSNFLSLVAKYCDGVYIHEYNYDVNTKHVIVSNTKQIKINNDYNAVVRRLCFIGKHILLCDFFNSSFVMQFVYHASYLLVNTEDLQELNDYFICWYTCQRYMYIIISIIGFYISCTAAKEEHNYNYFMSIKLQLHSMSYNCSHCVCAWLEEYRAFVLLCKHNDNIYKCSKHFIRSIIAYIHMFHVDHLYDINESNFFKTIDFIVRYLYSVIHINHCGNYITVVNTENGIHYYHIVNDSIVAICYIVCVYLYFDHHGIAGEIFLYSKKHNTNDEGSLPGYHTSQTYSQDKMDIFYLSSALKQDEQKLIHAYQHFETYASVFLFMDSLFESRRQHNLEKQYSYLCKYKASQVLEYTHLFSNSIQRIFNFIIDGIVAEKNGRPLYVFEDAKHIQDTDCIKMRSMSNPYNNNLFAVLKPYQQAAIRKSYNKTNFGYFLEMGMGKTLLILFDMTQYFDMLDSIIVCTRKYMFSIWQAEIKKFNLTYLNEKIVYLSIDSFSRNADKTLVNFVQTYEDKNVLFVFDESTMIKHVTSIRGVVLHFVSYYMQLRKGNITLIRLVTGTPYSNQDSQIASQIRMLDFFNCPSLSFFESFYNSMSTKFVACKQEIKNILDQRAFFAMKSEYKHIFNKVVRYYKLRRSIVDKSILNEYEKECKKLSVVNKYIDLKYKTKLTSADIKTLRTVGYTDVQYDLYRLKMLRNRYMLKLDSLASGLKTVKLNVKQDYNFVLDIIMFIINKYNDRRIVFVSKYISVAQCVSAVLLKHSVLCKVITGQVSSSARKKILDAFNRKEFNVIACTYTSMTYGFSIYCVDLVVLMDPCYSYEIYKQFMARTYRLNDSRSEMQAIFVFYGMQENIVNRILSRDKVVLSGELNIY